MWLCHVAPRVLDTTINISVTVSVFVSDPGVLHNFSHGYQWTDTEMNLD